MKKTIALFSIVLGTAAGVKAQALTPAPRPSVITLETVMISSVHAHKASCTNPIGIFSTIRIVCTCGVPYTTPLNYPAA